MQSDGYIMLRVVCRPAVLNLLRLEDHFVNFVLIHGQPLQIVQLAHSG